MGFYLNPGNKGFWESIRSKIYVDKTGLIVCTNELMNTEEKFICVSRPRCFGKFMVLKMPVPITAGGVSLPVYLKAAKLRKKRILGNI